MDRNKKYTVREIMEMLAKLPPDSILCVTSGDGCAGDIQGVQTPDFNPEEEHGEYCMYLFPDNQKKK